MDNTKFFEMCAEEALAQGGRRVGVGESIVLSPTMKLTVLGGYAVVSLDGQIKVATGCITISRDASPFLTFDDMVPSAGNGYPALSASMTGLLPTMADLAKACAATRAELKAAADAQRLAKTPTEEEAAEAKIHAAWVAYENAKKAEKLALAATEDPS